MVHHQELKFSTTGRGTYNIDKQINDAISKSNITEGMVNIFIQHPSASLVLCENADPDVRSDLETFMANLVPDGDPMFRHSSEGIDDMPAHVRTTLTMNSLSLPLHKGRTMLGTWQGVFLWEHRSQPHKRRVVVTVTGE